ncbi:Uncharacterised protein [Raoultella planticola]|uniref:Uncharacterized protein n=1 Tax=Raoultella planticola TaxID=575 RepID=A0A485C2H6_RAOPL|nr:Uncharacterised protein [Raoultella planticola]
MSTLQDLVAACQADKNLLSQQAQVRTESWHPWLARSAMPVRREKTRDMTRIFSVSAKRSTNFPASIPG